MKKPLLGALGLALVVSGCGFGQSRFNPVNWFGPSKKTVVSTVDPVTGVPLAKPDPRGLVADVSTMRVEAVPGGVIVRATGLPPTQGWWDGALLAENDGKPVKGVLTFRFVVVPPAEPTPSSTPRSRELTVAVHLTDFQLAGVRAITVTGANNARTARR
ncbi:hypothetical protein [Solirhodobacter olei]|jgi:hypothetical protein|uniref:hypothetical protein n=1 Tax=Solirhodobacter olei TaxID=2493082 RepID=UPI000FD7C0B4|nr:hypothetical protein [Solirhodobacter olei]